MLKRLHSFHAREWDTLHIPVWLIKDVFWVLEWKLLGILSIAPVAVVSVIIVWKSKHIASRLFPNLAVFFWMVGDACWMISDFYSWECMGYILTFFGLGIASMLVYYVRRA